MSLYQGKRRYSAEGWKNPGGCNVIHQKAYRITYRIQSLYLIIYLWCVSHPEYGGSHSALTPQQTQSLPREPPKIQFLVRVRSCSQIAIPFSIATIFVMFGITLPRLTTCPEHLEILQGKESMRKSWMYSSCCSSLFHTRPRQVWISWIVLRGALPMSPCKAVQHDRNHWSVLW